ncbi:MAG: mitochondrial fission ELM1 family protein [Hyphomicrobiales bacterium]
MTDGAQPSIWIITDGRRGDVVQCEAIAHRLSDNVHLIDVSPRHPWKVLMPWGPADPREFTKFEGPLPTIVIAANRQSYPYAKRIYRQSKGRTRVLFMKEPGRDVSAFAHIWAPSHDKLSGDHVIATLTAPHLVSQERLEQCKQTPDPRLSNLSGPKLAVILGGDSKHATYDDTAIAAFTKKLRETTGFNAAMITASRRTSDTFLKAVIEATPCPESFIWDGSGVNPYFHMLAEADAILVSGDSHNMVGEALASSVPVHVIEPTGNPDKFSWTIRQLKNQNLIAAGDQPIQVGARPSFDETPSIAEAVKRAFQL